MNVKQWTKCRICQSSPLETVLRLGDQAIVEFAEQVGDWKRAPLNLMSCFNCGLVQLEHSVEDDVLFRHFWYRSGINEQMKAALKEITEKAVQIARPMTGDSVLDIGSNDGTLLSCYPTALFKVGVEPARNIAQVEGGPHVLVDDYFDDVTVHQLLQSPQTREFKIVTAVAMFYDLDNPADLLFNVRDVLHQHGVLIIQMNYLPTMLKNLAFDNISHEHRCYYSLATFQKLAEGCGFDVVDCVENDVNGGSIRLYLAHTGSRPAGMSFAEHNAGFRRVEAQLEAEKSLIAPAAFMNFVMGIDRMCKEVNRFVADLVTKKGQRVCLYGASTRGTVTMQVLDITKYVIAAAERDPKKYGLTMAGTGIRIFSEEMCRSFADYFVVLPWHFLPSILEREKDWGLKGGRFIVPLPEPKVYSVYDQAAAGSTVETPLQWWTANALYPKVQV